MSDCVHRRSRMRTFNWDAIPRHSVVGKRNVWTSLKKQEDFPLDTQYIEELFSHSEQQRAPRRVGTVKKCIWGLPSTTQESEMVSIKSASIHFEVVLLCFVSPYRPMQDIIEDVRQGNMRFAADRLKELTKLLPDDVELKKLLSFSGSMSQLPEADRFLLMLVKIPGYEERIKDLLLREEFSPFMEEVTSSIAVMTAAANELLVCDDLHSIIRLVLKAGNYMNAGGYAGRAIGFRMASLLRLVDTKANKPGMNLMHYVAMQAQQIDRALLNFPEQLRHIGDASRIHKQEVETDFRREMEKIKKAKANASKQPDLEHQMEEFLQMAESRLAATEASLQELNSISHSVAEYFCEDPATFKLEECCSIFHSFCEKFDKAVKENGEREAAEKRQQQQREREAVSRASKRRSITTCSGRESDSEVSALESVLTSFLSDRPARRRQPSNRERPTELLNPLVETSQIAVESPAKTEKNSGVLDIEQPDQNPDQSFQTKEEIKPIVVVDYQTPKSNVRKAGSRRSVLIKQDPVDSECDYDKDIDNQETQQKETSVSEASRKVLRYQTSCGSLNGEPAPEHLEDTTVIWSPAQRETRDEDLFLNNNPECMGSPWTVLSPQVTPRNTPHRRHCFTPAARDEELDDGVWALPDTPVRHKPPLLANMCRSYEHSLSTSVLTEAGVGSSQLSDCPSGAPMLRSASLGSEAQDSAPGFHLGVLFHRRNAQEPPPSKRHEPSALVSFFRRFGDRGRPASVGDSHGTDI
uniref:FH2 domain containing 3 n=1 Tax=Astyanax mexicanus TaxID=7994 RepID=A0A8B9H480_ASTMX